MLSKKEKSIIQRIQDRQRDESLKFVSKRIKHNDIKIEIIRQTFLLVSEIVQANKISYEEAFEILKEYVNE
jgi:hypothetical protein